MTELKKYNQLLDSDDDFEEGQVDFRVVKSGDRVVIESVNQTVNKIHRLLKWLFGCLSIMFIMNLIILICFVVLAIVGSKLVPQAQETMNNVNDLAISGQELLANSSDIIGIINQFQGVNVSEWNNNLGMIDRIYRKMQNYDQSIEVILWYLRNRGGNS